mgnify:CR=1 FL=1
MPPYEDMYYHLFNAITDALREIEGRNSQRAAQILIAAQQWSEGAYVEASEHMTETE